MMFMITMPPTTMPIATTAGITVNSMRVRLFQNATSASAVSTEKSLSCARPQPVGDAHRLFGALPSPSATAMASGIFTEITVVWRRP